MDQFFDRQNTAQARSRTFYIIFTLAVAGAVVVFYFMLTGCFLAAGLFSPFRAYHPDGWWETLIQCSLPPSIYGEPKRIIALRPFLILIPAITAFVLLLSYYKISLIKSGGGVYVAKAMGGTQVGRPKNSDEKRLLNVVEEMALASGLPKPRVFILPKEWAINAVTAGLDYEDAVIAVTAGALKQLDRDELQGVIAHEYAHILNGDYALNLTMAGWLYGLLFFSVQGWDMMGIAKDLLDYSSKAEDGAIALVPLLALPIYLLGMVLWVGGTAGKLVAELTQAAMSRQREHLADAFAVQFTRNPRGLAGALKKIAGYPSQGHISNGQALMMRSFFIASPGRFQGLLRSHPPLDSRILALEPNWDGLLPEFGADHLWPLVNAGNEKLRPAADELRPLKKSPQALLQQADQLDGNWVGTLVLGLLAGYVGQYDTAENALHKSLELSRRLYEQIPPELLAAAEDTGLAASLISSIFLHARLQSPNGTDSPAAGRLRGRSSRPERESQQEIIKRFLGPESLARALKYKELMDASYRLPLLSLTSPTLAGLSEDARATLAGTVAALVAADGRLDLFEVAALQILKKRLKLKFTSSETSGENAAEEDEAAIKSAARPTPEANHRGGDESPRSGPGDYLKKIQAAVVVVMSILAHLGERRSEERKAREAFHAGMVHFNHWPLFDLLPRETATARELMLALEDLAEAPLNTRDTLVVAAISTAIHDNYISLEEYELLRALSAALDVPLPYFTA